jgi:sugar (pentulose or hexulose) kinase
VLVYAVDLGTTNIKVVLYDEHLHGLAAASAPMKYRRDGARVEFEPDAVFETVIALIGRCADQAEVRGTGRAHIAVTGQAESLVLVDVAGQPVAPGISWMDERSVEEAREIAECFEPTPAFATTGEPGPVPTWPATKLRWLARHRPDVLGATRRVLMIKDYLLFRLTGLAVGEETTRGFTYLYDVPGRKYWVEMLEFCGTRIEAMPEVVPAGTDIGPVLTDVADRLPRAASYTVNVGALDHFCAMVGTDSYRPGAVSASAGTVLSLAMLATEWRFDPAMKVSFHPGIRADETVLFTCADSGGVCLAWFQENIATELPYEEFERELWVRGHRDAPLFLPYLTGVNPPDFVADARGAFLGLQLRHDRIDLGYAVMEGVAHLLRRNLDHFAEHGQRADSIVSAGGGTASRFWNQLKADVCGLDFRTPEEPEAACRGAAVLALVAAGAIDSIESACSTDNTAHLHRPAERTSHPRDEAQSAVRYREFETARQRLYGKEAR